MKPELLEKLNKLNTKFCENALECSKNKTYRSVKKMLTLDDLRPYHIDVDRIDRNLVSRDKKQVLFPIDIDCKSEIIWNGKMYESGREFTLREMMLKSFEIHKAIHHHFPLMFISRWSGRGVHLMAKIERTPELETFLKQHNINIWYFMRGVVWRIIKEVSPKMTYKGKDWYEWEDYFDLQQYKKNAMTRGFTINHKALVSGHKVFAMPIAVEDDMNTIINKACLLQDFDDRFIEQMPLFNQPDLWIEPPRKYTEDLPRISLNEISEEFRAKYEKFPPCVKYALSKKALNYDQRFFLITFFRKIYIRFWEVHMLLKQHLSWEKFKHMTEDENQAAYGYAFDYNMHSCRTIRNMGLCVEGCKFQSVFEEWFE
jgi:hypothetical protein